MSFADRPGSIWYNGQLVSWPDATLHVLSHGLHYAQAVFEGERAYNGRIFKLEEHTRRLFRSAELLGFEIPFSELEVSEACKAVVSAQKIRDGYIRPIAWLGPETMGISPAGAKVNVAIGAWDWKHVFRPESKKQGIRLCTSRWRRPPPASSPVQAKAAGLYTICVLSRIEANAAGYDDALLLDSNGGVAEATGANLFVIKGDTVSTPETHSVLNGITRQTAIKMLRDMGFQMWERTIYPSELSEADEVFLTGTAYEILPVHSIDDFLLPSTSLGQKVASKYSELVHQ